MECNALELARADSIIPCSMAVLAEAVPKSLRALLTRTNPGFHDVTDLDMYRFSRAIPSKEIPSILSVPFSEFAIIGLVNSIDTRSPETYTSTVLSNNWALVLCIGLFAGFLALDMRANPFSNSSAVGISSVSSHIGFISLSRIRFPFSSTLALSYFCRIEYTPFTGIISSIFLFSLGFLNNFSVCPSLYLTQ